MSKKKISKNPDYLTRDAQAEVVTMTRESIAKKAGSLKEESSIAIKKAQANHVVSDKFGSHLDALFQEPIPLEEAEPVKRSAKRTRKVRPRMGLDSLIRNTRKLSSENAALTDELKRVTFIYSKNQLEKVRQISKFESIFMKDIIGEAVNQWLERYERKLMKAKN